jgi:hypothetical protein
MTHDSRRYHRTRRPTFARGYGMLGMLGGTAGADAAAGAATGAAADAATAGGIGSTIASGLESAAGPALTGLGKTALGGIESLGQGLQSLFTGGGGEAGHLADLGQAVPAGVDLVGPSSTFTGPGFLSSVYQGFIGGPQKFANPSAGTSAGAGIGQLMNALQQLQGQGGGPAKMPPIIQTGGPIRPLQVVPPANAGTVGPGPILGGLLGHL